MDASDAGLRALCPARRKYLQVQFNQQELASIARFRSTGEGDYNINLRELMSTVFASLVWGQFWSGLSMNRLCHVRFWIDNISAISWHNRRASRNQEAQKLLRILSLLEVQHSFYASADDHVAGDTNIMAYAGSRVWQSAQHRLTFTNLSSGRAAEQLKQSLAGLGAILRAGALADSSQKHYQRYWNQWSNWCDWMTYSPWLSQNTLGANATQLGVFAVFLWRFGMNKAGTGNTYTTICAKLCAVRWYHRNNLGYDPGVDASHAILLRGIRRFTSPVTKQHPLSVQLLRAILTSLDLQHARNRLLWGGLLLGYFFLLRRSEYLYIGHQHHAYVLKLGGISFYHADGNPCKPRHAERVGIPLLGVKNNQFGREEVRYHDKSGDANICPVIAARWIVKGARAFGTTPELPALSTGSGAGISARELANTIKSAARKSGVDPDRFSTHSVRIGGATALLNAGADRLAIKVMGRWLSSAFEEYPVLTAQGSAGLSKMMC
ncbi:Hypothetical protein PHPALM_10756 [Phytophthora palmivora]|uniref:Tyr recombinase domain-containing protein n=1 Tax=Phytophthora palmivora TaxID=4796 RepID=A0A2P4Y3X0_9STRA|nr:Hypothetical protein PHPALM_10756 [Phytophthora palmivora]